MLADELGVGAPQPFGLNEASDAVGVHTVSTTGEHEDRLAAAGSFGDEDQAVGDRADLALQCGRGGRSRCRTLVQLEHLPGGVGRRQGVDDGAGSRMHGAQSSLARRCVLVGGQV